MNRELELISTWLALNKLSLNVAKTHFILFKSSRKKLRSELTLKIKDQIISQVEYTKFLGVIIDSNLSWKQHINSVANKISKLTGILCKARHFVTRPLLKSIYYALIYPYIFHFHFISFSFIYLPATVYIKKELLNNRGNAARKPKEKPRGL